MPSLLPLTCGTHTSYSSSTFTRSGAAADAGPCVARHAGARLCTVGLARRRTIPILACARWALLLPTHPWPAFAPLRPSPSLAPPSPCPRNRRDSPPMELSGLLALAGAGSTPLPSRAHKASPGSARRQGTAELRRRLCEEPRRPATPHGSASGERCAAALGGALVDPMG